MRQGFREKATTSDNSASTVSTDVNMDPVWVFRRSCRLTSIKPGQKGEEGQSKALNTPVASA
jgi:hypothetical protein